MEQLLGRLGRLTQDAGNFGLGTADAHKVDTSETVHISSLALLKMLKHGRAGVPMEVMGLMLGNFVDDFTINVVDVFAMPQSGTGVSVEAVDPVFQAKMLEMLKQTGRPEMVVGWYHSHPGFGCWLSSTDVQTQQSFEALAERAVAVVIDPIQSVKGQVVIDAFRTFPITTLMKQEEPRQTTSNIGHLGKINLRAVMNGLGRHYYSIPVAFKANQLEQNMLLNLNKQTWMDSLALEGYDKCCTKNHESMKRMLKLAKEYKKSVMEEEKMSEQELEIKNVGKLDPKRHLQEGVTTLLGDNIVQNLGAMIDTTSFQ